MESLPIVVRIFILAFCMFAAPAVVGNCFSRMADADFEQGFAGLIFRWVSGQMLLWAGFQLICVPSVVRGYSFRTVAKAFSAYTAVLFVCGLAVCLLRVIKNRRPREAPAEQSPRNTDKMYRICWGIFAVLFLLQLLAAVFLTYADGDDAYYVAISTITNDADTMYQKLPYTTGTTAVDIRHGLAPFPVWISYLSWASGIRTVTTAHVAVQLMLIPMTYGVFGLLGKKLFAKRREALPVFLIFTELLVIFGGYSIYTAEHFMLARSRQGKTVLCSIIIPLLFLLALMLYEKLQAGEKCAKMYWLLLFCVAAAGCLCSTMGAVLVCLFLGVAGLCGIVCYRKWGTVIPLAFSCAPCVVFALLYMLLQ